VRDKFIGTPISPLGSSCTTDHLSSSTQCYEIYIKESMFEDFNYLKDYVSFGYPPYSSIASGTKNYG